MNLVGWCKMVNDRERGTGVPLEMPEGRMCKGLYLC